MKWILCLAGVLIMGCPGLEAQRSRNEPAGVWELLRSKYDKNKDGKITRAEYPREAEKFGAYDRDGDGSITRSDFSGGGRGGRRSTGGDRSRRVGALVARAADRDLSGDVTAKEWKSFLKSVRSGRKGVVDRDKLVSKVSRGSSGAASRMRGRMVVRALDGDRDGTIRVEDLGNLFSRLDRNGDRILQKSEIPARRGGQGRQQRTRLPRVGDVAPDFNLPTLADRSRTVKLSSYAGKMPVALLFGSYT